LVRRNRLMQYIPQPVIERDNTSENHYILVFPNTTYLLNLTYYEIIGKLSC
jgi:hypothetical protein